MPVEFSLLKDQPQPFDKCPKCGAEPFDQLMRGLMFANWWKLWKFFGMDYCTVVCADCQQIVGYEQP